MHLRPLVWGLLTLALAALLTGSAALAEPPGAAEPTKPKPRPAEITEMLWAIAGGSQMGPGEGWFHDGQGRYSWQWLADRFDADHDGIITREEFTGPAHLFDRLDANRDGVLTAADFNWAHNSPLVRQNMMASQWFRMLDTDSNGRISKEEWDAVFARAAKGKGYLTPDDLREAFPTAPPVRPPQTKAPTKPPANDGPSPLVFLSGLLSGELGSFHEGPKIDELAPDFTLKTQDGQQQITLSEFRGKKPVVLVFGSFT